MANPKVFISSTCYDLKQIRSDLKAFVESLGYEAVLSERHSVPFNVTETLEDDCYSEISVCDVVVGIIGGKFGTESLDGSGQSISMREMQSAIQFKKQMYIFVERNVYSEYSTYEKNKDSSIDWAHVDNPRIFEFIGELKTHNRIIINDFSVAQDIIDCLKSQWAGLFQSFLNSKERYYQNEGLTRIKETSDKLENNADSLKSIIDDLKNQIETGIEKNIYGKYYMNHVVVEFAKEFLSNTEAIMFFKTKKEMEDLLYTLGYEPTGYDSDNEYIIYSSSSSYFYAAEYIFEDDGNVKFITATQYSRLSDKPMFYSKSKTHEFPELDMDDGDLPF